MIGFMRPAWAGVPLEFPASSSMSTKAVSPPLDNRRFVTKLDRARSINTSKSSSSCDTCAWMMHIGREMAAFPLWLGFQATVPTRGRRKRRVVLLSGSPFHRGNNWPQIGK
jgi:hypothetical protein